MQRKKSCTALLFVAIAMTATPFMAEDVAKMPDRSRTLPSHAPVTLAQLSYDALGEYSTEERRSFVVSLSAAEQRALWEVHLTRFLQTQPGLTNAQKDVVKEALSLLSAGVIDQALSGEPALVEQARAHVSDLERRSLEVFPRALTVKLFRTLGPEKRPDGITRRFAPSTDFHYACGCSTFDPDNWDCDPYHFGTNRHCAFDDECEPRLGCGEFWMFGCNGSCAISG